MADKLTPQQFQAVTNRGGRLLVSAAAGSGKTKVLVDRLLSYLTDSKDPANLDDFLIITYTKAAASELRGKIAAKLTERIAQEPENLHLQKQMQRLYLAKISTVHGFCSDLLREYAYYLDIPADFRVADESECREIRDLVLSDLLDSAYENAQEHPDFRAFVDAQGLGRDDRFVPEIIEKVYDSARCHRNPDAWLDKCLAETNVSQADDLGQTVWGKYLLDDLRGYLDDQIAVLHQCTLELERCEGMEKPSEKIRNTVRQLQELRDAETWDQIVRTRNIDYGRLVFPKKNTDPDLCERVKAARNACKKELERKLRNFTDLSDQGLCDLNQSCASVRGLLDLVKQFEKDYSAMKRSRRVLDFSDLEQKTLDLLLGKSRNNPTGVSTEISRRFREILVDEYQDSNGVQDAIFDVLTREKHNCFFVGDVKQSIYQFRLADPGIFLKKYESYADAKDALPMEGRKVLLSHNFRSGAEVISCVNDVFSVCMNPKVGGLHYGEAESLREGIPHEPLPTPGVELYAIDVQEETYPEEAAFVAEKISNMLRTGYMIRDNNQLRSVQPDDIVILLRSPGSAAGYFQRALEAKGIRCSSGGGNDLLQTPEIGTFRSFLQTIQNPQQDIPLISTLASPIFGFSADELSQIRSCQKKGSFYDALLLNTAPKTIQFLKTLSVLRNEARMNPLTVLLEKCMQLTRLDSVYAAMPGGEAKSTNFQIFYQLASDFEKNGLRDLTQFLEYLNTLDERGMVVSGSSSGGCVTIMSIHKSKGLEFPVVFLCNLSRKFNQENLRARILCDKSLGLGLSVADHQNRLRYPSISKRAIAVKMASESISEEMRVLYVAMTRARDRLIMTYASRTLQEDIVQAALQQDFDHGKLFCQNAVCMGDWVLLAAVRRTEAGQIHALGVKPKECVTSNYPWKITVESAPVVLENENIRSFQMKEMPLDTEKKLREALSFQYEYFSATSAPSKQTATGRKGRVKDAEAAENTQEDKNIIRHWRRPSFLSDQPHGRDYGKALHAALQYINFTSCTDEQKVREEVRRLVEEGFLSETQGSLVNCEKIARFFSTEIGQKLLGGMPCLREFKFSILDDGSHYGEGLEGERVLLQGVVDCALLEEDGITIIDFKTDNVTEETVSDAIDRYISQLKTYGEALGRIYEMPIKKLYFYFFKLNRFIQI